jgi:hypothetical protein
VPGGYSGKPLGQKLGIRKGDVVAFLDAPDDYGSLLGKVPDEVIVARGLKRKLDFIQFFARDRATLERKFPRLKARLKQQGMIWVSWPKASARLETNLSDGIVREVGLKNGLVDVKVCAVDESWSALKFVRRLEDRETSSKPKKRRA